MPILVSMRQLLPLNVDELAFIKRRYRTESKLYMKTMNVLLIIGSIAPLAFCVLVIFLNQEGKLEMKNIYHVYFVGLAFMILFIAFIAFVSYRVKLLAYFKDKNQKMKVIELTNIKQKKYMKLNNTYHFYLTSPTKYTIEVSPQDFTRWQLGDEISIEYAQHSLEYFGYF